MRFDQVRREYKKTLWGEELDNERYAGFSSHTVDIGFLQQYEGKKYLCSCCYHAYGENEMLMMEYGRLCHNCFQGGHSS